MSRNTLYSQPEVRATIRQAALMVTEGYSLRSTCAYLNERGYFLRTGRRITFPTLWRVLTDQRIVAVVEERTGIDIIPLLSEALFLRLSIRLRRTKGLRHGLVDTYE